METLQFKTNINCSGCVAKVTPKLNEEKGIKSWEVDTENLNKVLTVKADQLTAELVIEVVKKAGFKIETIKSK